MVRRQYDVMAREVEVRHPEGTKGVSVERGPSTSGSASSNDTSISLPLGHRDTLSIQSTVVAGAYGGIVLHSEYRSQQHVRVLKDILAGHVESLGIDGSRSHLPIEHCCHRHEIRDKSRQSAIPRNRRATSKALLARRR